MKDTAYYIFENMYEINFNGNVEMSLIVDGKYCLQRDLGNLRHLTVMNLSRKGID